MKHLYSISVLSAFISGTAFSQPLSGTLFGKGSVAQSYMSYDCDREGSDLKCNIDQISLRPKLNRSDYEEKRAQLLTQMQIEVEQKGWETSIDEICSPVDETIRPLLTAIQTENYAILPDDVRIHDLTDESIEDLRLSLQPYIEICDARPKDALERIVEISLYKELKTCSLMTNQYQMVFKETSDNVFSSQIGPTGSCGVINIGIFSPAPDAAYHYTYREERIITNRNGEGGLVNCADLEQKPVVEYDWKPVNEYRNCVYIGF